MTTGNEIEVTDNLLGDGAQGRVYEGRYNGSICAIKRLPKHAYQSTRLSNEIEVWKECKHKNLVQYFTYRDITIENYPFTDIVLELCDGSLDEFIKEPVRKSFNNKFTKKGIMIDVALGLEYLHSKDIVHKDIKPENIMLSNPSVLAKLTDFGISKVIDPDTSSFDITSACTRLWAAPELLDIHRHDSQCKKNIDVFSLGLVYYYTQTGLHLFGSGEDCVANIITGRHADISSTLPENYIFQDLLKSMIKQDYNERSSSVDVVNHPYFWDGDKCMNLVQMIKDKIGTSSNVEGTIIVTKFNTNKCDVLGSDDWREMLEQNVKRYLANEANKTYEGSFIDLIYCITNTFEQLSGMPDEIKRIFGSTKDDVNKYTEYWFRKFPKLLIWLYHNRGTAVENSSIGPNYSPIRHSSLPSIPVSPATLKNKSMTDPNDTNSVSHSFAQINITNTDESDTDTIDDDEPIQLTSIPGW